jgi:hypothetical protein
VNGLRDEHRQAQAESRDRCRMAWVPKVIHGTLRTQDGRTYRATVHKGDKAQGTADRMTIQRVWPKERGKKARAADKLRRRQRRAHQAQEKRIVSNA